MSTIKGGEFLIKETKAEDIFIPEQWNEEQLMIAQTCQEFLAQEVHPNLDRIDNQEEGLMESLLEKYYQENFCKFTCTNTQIRYTRIDVHQY